MQLTEEEKKLFNDLFTLSQSIANIYQKMFANPNLIEALKSAVEIENRLILNIKEKIPNSKIFGFLNNELNKLKDELEYNYIIRIYHHLSHLANQEQITSSDYYINEKKLLIKKEDILEILKIKNIIAIMGYYQKRGIYSEPFLRKIYSLTYHNTYAETAFLKKGHPNQELASTQDIFYLSYLYNCKMDDIRQFINFDVKNYFNKEYLYLFITLINANNADICELDIELEAIKFEALLLLLPKEMVCKIFQEINNYCLTNPVEVLNKAFNRRLLEIFFNIEGYQKELGNKKLSLINLSTKY